MDGSLAPDLQSTPHRVVAVAYDQLWPHEFGIAAEIFGWRRPEIDVPWYEFSVAAWEDEISAFGGFTVKVPHGLEALETADTIVLPGWRRIEETPPEVLLEAVRRAYARGARILSYCSGVFVLACAGILAGKKATAHWRHTSELRRRFPELKVVEDVLYVDNGQTIISAGSSAACDASLHLIRRDYGASVANMVARSLVTPPHRDGGQAQFIAAPVQERPGKSIAGVIDWARENLNQSIAVTQMAEQAGMSQRTFLRRFNDSMGVTPLKWLRRERVYRAMNLLETSPMSLDDVAEQCGFDSTETFRVAFREIAGTPPASYRRRFCCPETLAAGAT